MKRFLKNIFYSICLAVERLHPTNKGHILMYHSFNLPEVFFNVTFDELRQHLELLKKHSFTVVSVEEFLQRKKQGLSLKKCVAITCDDGYLDFADAAEIFDSNNAPITLFWPTGLPQNKIRLSNGREYAVLSYDQVAVLLSVRKNLAIASHGVTHVELNTIAPRELSYEIAQSKKDIAGLASSVSVLAYPRGKYNPDIVSKVKEAGYDAAFTTKEGGVDKSTNVFELPRISVDSTVDVFALRAKLTRLYDWYAIIRQ